MKISPMLTAIMGLVLCGNCGAKELTAEKIGNLQGHGDAYVGTDPRRLIKDQKVLDNLESWQDLKFGFFVHWGAYSQWGRESWTLSPEKDWGRSKTPAWKACGEDLDRYRQAYWDLNKTFNPVGFDAEKWADMAASAGMKYFVFTTMHHDGFVMFDSKYTDYKITGPDCPYHTQKNPDVTKALFDAFHKKGFKIGTYYSKPSWYNNDFWIKDRPITDRNANYDVTQEPERWERFVQFTHNQIDQLMSNYGKIDILWLDGGWVNPAQKHQDIRMAEIAAKGREKQPGLIVVDRTIHGEFENYVTPEQKVPAEALSYPWETCMTMGKSWSYKENDVFKPTIDCIHLLVDVVSKGGNLLLNLGASPDGWFDPIAVKQMKEIGAWMDVNGEAIYATRPVAPYKSGKVAFTRKKTGEINAIYLADKDEKMPESITISGLDASFVKSVKLLGSGSIKSFRIEDNQLVVSLPEAIRQNPPCNYAWTFVLGQ